MFSFVYDFFFLQISGSSFDHGSIASRNSRFVSSICFGISVSRNLKYWYMLSSLAFAVSTMLYNIALACAPWTVSISFQFFFPTQNGLIACSARLLSNGICGSLRKTRKYFSWFKQYWIPFAVSDDGGTLLRLSLHQWKKESTSGFTRVFLRFLRSAGGSFCNRLSVW